MSPIHRMCSVALTSAAAIALVIATGPTASASTCNAPEANVDPPAASPRVPNPVPVQRPTGRQPRGANPSAPIPKLGPLISRLLRPNGSGYALHMDDPDSGQLQQQAGVLPPAPPPPQPAAAAAPPVVAAPAPAAAPVAPDAGAAIGGANTSLVEWITGPNSPNKTLERFGISGTDLGIPWDNGDPANRQILLAFGDTFGYCKVDGQQWRNNVLFRSQDQNLNDGILVGPGVLGNKYSGAPILQSGYARAILPGVKWAREQTGMIPTAAIAVDGKQYMNFMSIKQWGRDGEWSTNYSAIAMSPDNGEHWGIYPGSVRSTGTENVPGAPMVPGNENFQMGAFLRGGDGYMYSFGTPSGRAGSIYLSRAPERALPDLTKYQYWNGDSNSWVPANPGAATPVIPGPAGEMSAQYNTYLRKFLVLYTNANNDVVARTAPAPQGPWSPEQMLVSSFQMPGGIYGPFLHPWSTGKDVYFTLSSWNAYDVMLMHTVLA